MQGMNELLVPIYFVMVFDKHRGNVGMAVTGTLHSTLFFRNTAVLLDDTNENGRSTLSLRTAFGTFCMRSTAMLFKRGPCQIGEVDSVVTHCIRHLCMQCAAVLWTNLVRRGDRLCCCTLLFDTVCMRHTAALLKDPGGNRGLTPCRLLLPPRRRERRGRYVLLLLRPHVRGQGQLHRDSGPERSRHHVCSCLFVVPKSMQ